MAAWRLFFPYLEKTGNGLSVDKSLTIIAPKRAKAGFRYKQPNSKAAKDIMRAKFGFANTIPPFSEQIFALIRVAELNALLKITRDHYPEESMAPKGWKRAAISV